MVRSESHKISGFNSFKVPFLNLKGCKGSFRLKVFNKGSQQNPYGIYVKGRFSINVPVVGGTDPPGHWDRVGWSRFQVTETHVYRFPSELD